MSQNATHIPPNPTAPPTPAPPTPPPASPASSTAALVPKPHPPQQQRKSVLETLLSGSKHPYTYMSDMGLAVDAAQAQTGAASKRTSSDGGRKDAK